MPRTTEIRFLLLVAWIQWMLQRNHWLHNLAHWITDFVLGGHLNVFGEKEHGRRHTQNKYVQYIPHAYKLHSSLRLCLTAAALLYFHNLCWISRCHKVQNKRFLVLENQHHIFTSSCDDNMSNSFSGNFFLSFDLRSINILGDRFQLFKLIRIYFCLYFIAKMLIWNF